METMPTLPNFQLDRFDTKPPRQCPGGILVPNMMWFWHIGYFKKDAAIASPPQGKLENEEVDSEEKRQVEDNDTEGKVEETSDSL